MRTLGYAPTPGEFVVEVKVKLTAEQFHAVQTAIEEPPARHKEWSDHFVWGDLTGDRARAACAVLRAARVPHLMTVEWSWTP